MAKEKENSKDAEKDISAEEIDYESDVKKIRPDVAAKAFVESEESGIEFIRRESENGEDLEEKKSAENLEDFFEEEKGFSGYNGAALKEALLEKGAGGMERFKLDAETKKEMDGLISREKDGLMIGAKEEWYERNKESLMEEGVYMNNADESLIAKIFADHEKEAVKDILNEKEYKTTREKFDRYRELDKEIKKEEPSIAGYFLMMDEIKRLIKKEQPEKGKLSPAAMQRIGNLYKTGIALAEKVSGRNFRAEAENSIKKLALKDFTSESAVEKRRGEIVEEYAEGKADPVKILGKYGWKVDVVSPRLFSRGKTIFRDRDGKLVKEFVSNFWGNYDRAEMAKFVKQQLNEGIKRDLVSEFDAEKKRAEEKINTIMQQEFFRFNKNPEEIISAAAEDKKEEIVAEAVNADQPDKTEEEIEKIRKRFEEKEIPSPEDMKNIGDKFYRETGGNLKGIDLNSPEITSLFDKGAVNDILEQNK
ncbi:MAG: hypothetical protein PHG23_00410 [Candidatus Pacebacteria bacterium]|nr:hypothetical protein [Candidatus Paceibacterota bacterium]